MSDYIPGDYLASGLLYVRDSAGALVTLLDAPQAGDLAVYRLRAGVRTLMPAEAILYPAYNVASDWREVRYLLLASGGDPWINGDVADCRGLLRAGGLAAEHPFGGRLDAATSSRQPAGPVALTPAERDATAGVIEAHLIDDGDGTAFKQAVVTAIGNTNIDETAFAAALKTAIIGGTGTAIATDANGYVTAANMRGTDNAYIGTPPTPVAIAAQLERADGPLAATFRADDGRLPNAGDADADKQRIATPGDVVVPTVNVPTAEDFATAYLAAQLGTGPYAVSVIVADAADAPIQGAAVVLRNGVERMTGTTGVAGTVGFSPQTLGDHALLINAGLAGSSATTVAVADGDAYAVVLTPTAVAPAEDPDRRACVLTTRDGAGAILGGVAVTFTLTGGPGTGGQSYGETVVVTSDPAGNLTVDLLLGGTYIATRDDGRENAARGFTVPDAQGFAIPEVRGR